MVNLTLRELEVIELLEEGCSNQEISDRLFIPRDYTRAHMSSLYKKFKMYDRQELINHIKEIKSRSMLN